MNVPVRPTPEEEEEEEEEGEEEEGGNKGNEEVVTKACYSTCKSDSVPSSLPSFRGAHLVL